MKSKRNTIAFVTGVCILAVMVIADLFCEGVPSHDVMIRLRAPRIITALLAGAALALSGAQMQSIFRNPLADPHIMGVSAGASLGAATATMIGGAAAGYGLSTALAAFTGAVCAAMIIIAVSKKIPSCSDIADFRDHAGIHRKCLCFHTSIHIRRRKPEIVLQLVGRQFLDFNMATDLHHALLAAAGFFHCIQEPERTGYHTFRRRIRRNGRS